MTAPKTALGRWWAAPLLPLLPLLQGWNILEPGYVMHVPKRIYTQETSKALLRTWSVWTLAPFPTCSKSTGKAPHLCEPRFPHLQNRCHTAKCTSGSKALRA